MRAAGTVQVLSSKSISSQRAPITSPVRAAVRIGKFERAGRDALLLAQARQEGRQLGIGQGGMVLDFAHLGARRQQFVEVPAPARRVFAVAIAAHLGQIQNAFEAPAQAACRFGLRRPDRFQHLEHKAGVHRLHRQRADDRIGIGGKRRRPLAPRACRCASRRGGR